MFHKFIASLLFISTLLAFAIAADQQSRIEFLTFYYNGEYQKAHSMLAQAISDSVTRELWENRIHLQENISRCSGYDPAKKSLHALALLRMGKFEEAAKNDSHDWISYWSKAVLAQWTMDYVSARKLISEALALQPERPELLFFAGDLAERPEETIDYFTRFLNFESEDPVSRNIADLSIQFLKKTAGIQLNIVAAQPGIQEIETDYDRSGTTIHAVVNSREKVKLMVDTGAGSGLVLAKREWQPQISADVVMLGLGKKQISNSKRMVLNLFDTGKFAIKNPMATESRSLPSHDIDGLIGTALFSTHRILLPVRSGKNLVLIPYDRNPEEYFASKEIKFKKQFTLPFYMVNKLIILKGRIKNSPSDLDILLDTGSDRSLIATSTAKKFASINYPLSLQLRSKSTILGVGGKSDSLLIAENVEVGLGESSRNFENLMTVNLAESSEALGLEVDLLLGRDFLDGYTLLIDYRNREVTFYK
jgi:tetratricopeptide (TPR) repeat protein